MSTIEELQQLAQWIRKGDYNKDEARDEIARAIENRIRFLETKTTYDYTRNNRSPAEG